MCRWQVQVSVYCARHLRCTQCSILLHLIDIFFLTCICLWQISQIQTCFRVVVGPGLVSTSPVFLEALPVIQRVRMSGFPKKTVIGPHCWGREGSTQYAQGLPDRCDSYTACRLCRVEPGDHHHHQ